MYFQSSRYDYLYKQVYKKAHNIAVRKNKTRRERTEIELSVDFISAGSSLKIIQSFFKMVPPTYIFFRTESEGEKWPTGIYRIEARKGVDELNVADRKEGRPLSSR